MSDRLLTEDSSLGALIAEFVRSAATDAERRERRAALSHVDAELGMKPVRTVQAWDVAALLDDLRNAGLSARRETAILDALRSLYGFAGARRLVLAQPVPEPTEHRRVQRRSRPSQRVAPEPPAKPTPTPTLTMLALGARMAAWTAWLITLVFAVLFVALVIELA